MEEKADRFARNILIPLNQYKKFIAKKDIRLVAIREFANQCGVQTFIVLGRLMKDGILDWNAYSRERIRYVWE
jgi:HTH-type transcriptional regulator/antitoxin HigA